MTEAHDIVLDDDEELALHEFILDPGHDLDAALQGDTSGFDGATPRANTELTRLLMIAIAGTFFAVAAAAVVVSAIWSLGRSVFCAPPSR